ncbi:MAG TPA: S8 family serine peptidase [Candidatus Obscuribacterales bacterium]
MQKLRSLILTLSALTLVACQSGPMMPLQAGVQRMGARPLQSFANRSAKYQLDQVVVGAANPAQLQALAAKFQAQIVRQIAPIGVAVLQLPEGKSAAAVIQQLKAEPGVRFAEAEQLTRPAPDKTRDPSPNRLRSPLRLNDPLLSQQFGLERIQAGNAWANTMGSPNVVVAVIDSGVHASHEDLKDHLVEGYDAFHSRKGLQYTDPSRLSLIPSDKFASFGHGTHCAGIIAASGNNGRGISGVAPNVKIMPVKIFPSIFKSIVSPEERERMNNPETMTSVVAEGIVWASEHGADVINLSLGFNEPSKSLELAVNYALAKNVTVVVASGNERHQGNPTNYLSAVPGAIAVGATDVKDEITFFSNAGKHVSVAAPGFDILSTMPTFLGIGKEYQLMSGTSMAAPHVAGLAALLKSIDKSASPAEIKQVMEMSADDLGAPGFDELYGHGRINAAKAVALMMQRRGLQPKAPPSIL